MTEYCSCLKARLCIDYIKENRGIKIKMNMNNEKMNARKSLIWIKNDLKGVESSFRVHVKYESATINNVILSLILMKSMHQTIYNSYNNYSNSRDFMKLNLGATGQGCVLREAGNVG